MPSGELVSCQRLASPLHPNYEMFHIGYIGDKVVIDDEKLEKYSLFASEKRENCKKCFAQYYCAGICGAIRINTPNDKIPLYCEFTKDLLSHIMLANALDKHKKINQ